MNCIWKDIPNTEDERGWRKTACLRCGHKTAPWPTGQRHHRECSANPLWHDFGYWIEWPLDVFFVDRCRWLWLKAKLGLQPKCGCEARAASLNTIGSRLAAWFQSLRRKLTVIVRR